jgi:antitoxin VapB
MVPFGYISTIGVDRMALNIKDRETERLAAEVAAMTGESKTRAVKVALRERKERLALGAVHRDRAGDLVSFLEEEVWPQIPRAVLGKKVSRREREAILGYGPEGV